MAKTTSRNYGLDIVRVFAFCSVVSVHYFLNTPFYNVQIQGGRLYIATLLRVFSMVCVPLFLLLSGYLMRKKKATKQYYLKLVGILMEYLLASLCCAIYELIIHGIPEDLLRYLKETVLGVFFFQLAPYSWYVEMYIGLFLLIPYLNIIYENMDGQKGKQKLILTMLLLTSIPCMTHIVPVHVWGQLKSLRVFPEYWIEIYPITYYFIGAYLSEYPLKIAKSRNLLLIFLTAVISGSLCYWKSYGNLFEAGAWQLYQSGFIMVQAILVFTLLSQVSLKPDGKAAKLVSYLSGLCFSAYLVSYIFDQIVYGRLGLGEATADYKIAYFIVAVPLVILLSLMLSAVIQNVCVLLYWIAHKIQKVKKASMRIK